MSVVIAIKDRDRVILAADKQVSGGNRKGSTVKVWKVNGYDECCIGSVGTLRASQVIQYVPNLLESIGFGSKEITEEILSLHLTRVIFETLKAYRAIDLDEDEGLPFGPKVSLPQAYLPNEFFFAYKDKCWKIHRDLSISEVYDYDAIGSGEEFALSSLDTAAIYNEDNPYKAAAQAIGITAYRTLYVNNEFDFVETKEYEDDDYYKLAAVDPEAAKEVLDEMKKAIKAEKEAKKKAKEDTKKAEEKAKLAAEKKANKKKQKLVENIKEAE